MGNKTSQLQKEALDEIATRTKQEKDNKKIKESPNGDDGDGIKASAVQSALEDVDLIDKLLVFGYFRQMVLNMYDLDIPRGIINFVILYLFFLDENELYIGNICEVLNTTSRNRYKWTMFISTSTKELVPPKTIKSVKYSLHPSFRPAEQTIRSSPFKLSRRGWGTFDIEAEIEFKDKYKKEKCFAAHYLDFDHYASMNKVYQQDSDLSQVEMRKRTCITYKDVTDYPEKK